MINKLGLDPTTHREEINLEDQETYHTFYDQYDNVVFKATDNLLLKTNDPEIIKAQLSYYSSIQSKIYDKMKKVQRPFSISHLNYPSDVIAMLGIKIAVRHDSGMGSLYRITYFINRVKVISFKDGMNHIYYNSDEDLSDFDKAIVSQRDAADEMATQAFIW